MSTSATPETRHKNPRPDRSAFDKELEALRKDFDAKQAIATKKRNELNAHKAGEGKNSEWDKLQAELTAAKEEKQAATKAISGPQDQVKALDQEVQKKVKDIQTARPKTGPRTDDEFAKRIAELETAVDSGSLELVAERKTIKEITQLKNARRQFENIAKLQAEVDTQKAKITELRASIDEKPIKAAQAKILDINKKLDTVRSSRDSMFKDRKKLFDESRTAREEAQKVWEAMEKLKTDFHTKLNAFRDEAKRVAAEREESEKVARAEAAKSKVLADAQKKVDAAKVPAFAAQISKAQSLLAFFDPSYKREASEPSSSGSDSLLTKDTSIQASRTSRKVEALPVNATVLSKHVPQAELSRKQQKRRGAAPASAKSDKLQLDISMIEDLSALNIGIPSSAKDVDTTKSKLLEKIEFYKSNNERVTQERLDRAKEDYATLEKQIADGTYKPSSGETKTAKGKTNGSTNDSTSAKPKSKDSKEPKSSKEATSTTEDAAVESSVPVSVADDKKPAEAALEKETNTPEAAQKEPVTA